MTKLTQRWTGRLSILAAAAVLLTGAYAGLNKWKLAANATSASAKTLNPQQEPFAEAKVKSAASKLPLAFEANLGQTDARAKYVARASGYTAFLTEKDAVLSMQSAPGTTAAIRMEFEGSSGAAAIVPDEKLPGTATYMVGDRANWRKNVPLYAKVRYQNIYPGIDVVYQGDARQFRYDFVVKPGADPKTIRMNFAGAEKVSVTKDGDLALEIDGKTLVNKKPYLYQEAGGDKIEIAGNYTVSGNKVGFEVGSYDTAQTLVIDPVVVVSSYVGGSLIDGVNAVAVNTSSNPAAIGIYATGVTNSVSFPGAAGVTTGATIGLNDVFVVKTNLGVTAPLYLIYLGGTNNDAGNAIAVDAIGRASVSGTTFSSNFGGLTNASGGLNDGWYVRLNALGNGQEAGLYIGGSTNDFGTGIALDNNGNAPYNTFIGGYTDSPFLAGFAATTANAGSSDAFIAKILDNGVAVSSARTYGGTGAEIARGIAVLQPHALNAAGSGVTNVNDPYIVGDTTGGTGFTSNDNTLLSVGVGTPANPRDPFLVRANNSDLAANYTSFIYGNIPGAIPNPATADDSLNAVAVDPFGRAILAGKTRSGGLSTAGAFQPAISPGPANYDCWAGRVQPAVAAPVNYISYYGATGSDEDCLGVGTDSTGQIYFAGSTTLIAAGPNALQMANGAAGTLANPPVAGPLGIGGFTQVANGAVAIGEVDAFKARLNPNAVGASPAIPQLNIAEFFYGATAGLEIFNGLAVTQDRVIVTGGNVATSGVNTINPTWQTTLKGTQDGVITAQSVNDVLAIPDGNPSGNLLNPNAGLTFDYADTDAVPASQTFVVSFTGATLPFTLPAGAPGTPCVAGCTYSGGATPWLNVPQPDITPGVVRVSINTAAAATLLEGTYTVNFNVTAPGSDNGAVQVRVTLIKRPNVTEPVSSLTYNYDIATNLFTGPAAQTQADTFTTNDFASSSTVTLTTTYGGATPAGVQWLQANKTTATTQIPFLTLGTGTFGPIATPAGDAVLNTLNFRVCPNSALAPCSSTSNTTTLAPGVYTATVSKAIARAKNSPFTINITLNVTNSRQTIQLTPNATPTLYPGQAQTIFATVANPVLSGIFTTPDTVGWSLAGFGSPTCTGGTVGIAPNDTLSTAGPSSTAVFTARSGAAAVTAPTTVVVASCRPAPGQPADGQNLAGQSNSSLSINLLPASGVTLAPAGPLTLYAGQTQQFVTTIANAPGVTASYAVSSGPGSIGTTSGIYVAPSPIAAAAVATVQATIVALDGTKTSNTVTINLSPPSTLSVAPTSATKYENQTQQITATTTNPAGNPVTFSLAGPGAVDAGGLYTAPSSVPVQVTATVTATSVFPDGTRTAVSNITLVPLGTAACSPAVIYGNQTSNGNQTSTCTAVTINPPVWAVVSGGGTISAAGVYTAPAPPLTPTTVTVSATDGGTVRLGTITVLPASAITVVPALTSLYAGNQFLFAASIVNANGVQPTWAVTGAGSITTTGLYTAPTPISSASTATVTATLNTADGPRSSTATVNLLPNPVMTPANANLYQGQSQQYTVAAPPAGFTLTFSVTGGGTINPTTGLYTAPNSVPVQTTATITATIATNLGQFAASTTSTATLFPPSTLAISPTSTSLKANQTQTFVCSSTNLVPGTPACTFQVLNPSPLTGTVNATTGVYTAPGTVASALAVTVRATLAALDAVRTADAIVNLVPASAVTVSPASAILYASQSVGLTANVAGSAGGDVITWTVAGAGSLNTTTGASVTYTAPGSVLTSQSVTVTASAFNASDGTRTASAIITLVPPVSVSVAPATSGPLYPAGTALASSVTLTATVLNTIAPGTPTVTWTLSGPGSLSNATGTTVTYNAPAAPGVTATAIITATATSPDPSGPKTGSASVTVSPQVGVTVSPASANIFNCLATQFSATVTNASNTAVTWSVVGGGTISATGLYTPVTVQSATAVTVTATSVFDPTKSASSQVVVFPSICTGGFDNERFIKRNYIDFLGRNPEPAGSAYWVNQITSGTLTRAQVGQAFFNSPEFRQTGLVVANAYVGLLGRDPDYAGFVFWLTQIRSGTGQTALFNTFVTSPEFVGTYGNTTDTQYINLLYLNTLQRPATASDLAFWVPQVPSLGRAKIAEFFVLSDEFNIRFRTRQLSNLLYLGFLGRTPDPLGRQFWTNELNQGISELVVIGNFIISPEYLIRLAATPLP